MEYSDIQQGLNGFVERYDSQTFIGSYRDTTRDSLLKDGLTTRANSLWKMAEYVVAKYDSKPDEPIANYLRGWKELASRMGNQYLLIALSDNTWEMYDSNGIRLGGEDYIVEYFNRKKLDRNLNGKSSDGLSRQIIYYGAPGTGKSNKIDELTNEGNRIRTTFHPDSDYSTFVGAYKPTMKKQLVYEASGSVREEEQISYSFVPQAFIKAYVKAWERKNEGIEEPYYLVIEEINRGNCAQIFGNLFQLLDRDEDGYSKYEISPDEDILQHLAKVFKDFDNIPAKIKSGEVMKLPNNLYIWATMNTSDQSLFPIDSAFKRRWDWEYIPIKYNNMDWEIVLDEENKYKWTDFQHAVNDKLKEVATGEDKMLGDFFVNVSATKVITAKMLLNKILFYLWSDVCKDGEGDIFRLRTGEGDNDVKTVTFAELFLPTGEPDIEKLKQLMWALGLKPVKTNDNTESQE